MLLALLSDVDDDDDDEEEEEGEGEFLVISVTLLFIHHLIECKHQRHNC